MYYSVTNSVKETLTTDKNAYDLNESASLRLTKYVRFDENIKKTEIDAVVKCHNDYVEEQEYFETKSSELLYMTLQGRLIVNQAGGVLENAGLCLHRNLSYPYIPGSAVKGCARHYAWETWNNMDDSEEKEKTARLIALTFGYPTNDKKLDFYLANISPSDFGENGKYKSFSGSIAFMYAAPYGKAKLVTDILTCHHPDYYAGKPEYLLKSDGKALDNEQPIPLPFPTVESGSTFVFQLIPLKNSKDSLDFAKQMLKEALEINGIGAKTSAGYGWFTENETIMNKLKKEKSEKLAIELAEQKDQKERTENPVQFFLEKLTAMESQTLSGFAKSIADKNEDKKKAFHQFLNTKPGRDAKKRWKKKNWFKLEEMNQVFNAIGLESIQ